MSKKVMEVKGLSCTFNMPKQEKSKKDKNGVEQVHSLPPYAPVDAYVVDQYPACPSSWMHGSGISSSYFVGVKEGHGMWLDFNSCFHHTHDVSIVLSIQGINPITGQKMVGDKCLRLEKYVNKCPIHKVKFQQERYCPECKFKWPGQNYLSTTGTPFGRLWLDGFRTPDGTIRQYIITEDEKKGVAAQLIGDERVFAIGIAFYLSKKKKPEPSKNDNLSYGGLSGSGLNQVFSYASGSSSSYSSGGSSSSLRPKFIGFMGRGASGTRKNSEPKITCCANESNLLSWNNPDSIESGVDSFAGDVSSLELQSIVTPDPIVKEVTPVKQLEIGAGALISQSIYDDPQDISFWQSKPTGMIYINYCDEETMKRIIDAGKRQDEKEGFMQGLNVGA